MHHKLHKALQDDIHWYFYPILFFIHSLCYPILSWFPWMSCVHVHQFWMVQEIHCNHICFSYIYLFICVYNKKINYKWTLLTLFIYFFKLCPTFPFLIPLIPYDKTGKIPFFCLLWDKYFHYPFHCKWKWINFTKCLRMERVKVDIIILLFCFILRLPFLIPFYNIIIAVMWKLYNMLETWSVRSTRNMCCR